MDTTLRPATQDDGDFLFALHRSSLGSAIEATWGPWDDSVQRSFHDEWFDDPARLSIVLVDGQPAGVLDVREEPAGTLYVGRIELMPDVQGRGLGTHLLQQAVDQARMADLRAVELDVLQQNPAARRLYERLGFEVVSEAPPKQRMRLSM